MITDWLIANYYQALDRHLGNLREDAARRIQSIYRGERSRQQLICDCAARGARRYPNQELVAVYPN